LLLARETLTEAIKNAGCKNVKLVADGAFYGETELPLPENFRK
jgi:hypothetical protein